MAAAFIHYFLGVGIAYLFGYREVDALIVGLVGALQDLDFVSLFLYRYTMKSKYARLLTHRGITHTFLFSLISSAFVFIFSPLFSLMVLTNFLLHIFTDYVTAWGVAPLAPFSYRRYSLGLMTIFDPFLTVLSALCGISGFFSVNLTWPFAAFFGYIVVRFVVKSRLKYNKLVPMGMFTYSFCVPENHYLVGKIDVLGREKTISVPKFESQIDPELLEKVNSKMKKSMLSQFLEYPTYSLEGDSVILRDARSFLFSSSGPSGFTLYFDRRNEKLYMLVRGRQVELH